MVLKSYNVKCDPLKHHRRFIRLKEHDYTSAGGYFVSICTQGKNCLFGNVVDEEMLLNRYGHVVMESWDDLPNHYPQMKLDVFIIMPNHVHGIVVLTDVGAGLKPAPTKKRHGLSEIIRAFKTFSSRKINKLRKTPGKPVWQRNYFERVV